MNHYLVNWRMFLKIMNYNNGNGILFLEQGSENIEIEYSFQMCSNSVQHSWFPYLIS